MSDDLVRRMNRLPREARRGAILELQRLIADGEGDRTAMRVVRERYGVSVATTHRWLNVAYADWNRARRMSRASSLSRALVMRDHAKRIALGRRRHLIVGGRVVEVPDPDARTYLRACDSEARLLGLFDSDALETAKRFVADVVRELVAVVDEEVADAYLRSRLVRRFHDIVEGRGAGRRSGRGVVVDAAR